MADENKINDGGPAFPAIEPRDVQGVRRSVSEGMSLRDYAEIECLKAVITSAGSIASGGDEVFIKAKQDQVQAAKDYAHIWLKARGQ